MDDAYLPSVYDVTAFLSMDVDGLVVSVEKVEALRELFGEYVECFTEPAANTEVSVDGGS